MLILKLILTFILFNNSVLNSKSEIVFYEPYEEKLRDLVKGLFNEQENKEIENKKISDFYYKKTINLSFREACELFIVAIRNPKKNSLQVQHSLERMYSLCPDARVSELILWNLANNYSNDKKYSISGEMFSHFRKLFPGSKYYWEARINEIFDFSKLCLTYHYDSSQTENVIAICKQYIIDCNALSEKIDERVIGIMQDMYINIMLKEIDIIEHYLQKYVYMRDGLTVYSAFQRVCMFTEIIDSALDYRYYDEENLKDIKFKEQLEKIRVLIRDFRKTYDLTLPMGRDFKEIYDSTMEYIEKNRDKIRKDIICLKDSIVFELNKYYEKS